MNERANFMTIIKSNINDSEPNARMNTGRRKKIFNKFKDKFDKLLDLKILFPANFFLLCAVERRAKTAWWKNMEKKFLKTFPIESFPFFQQLLDIFFVFRW